MHQAPKKIFAPGQEVWILLNENKYVTKEEGSNIRIIKDNIKDLYCESSIDSPCFYWAKILGKVKIENIYESREEALEAALHIEQKQLKNLQSSIEKRLRDLYKEYTLKTKKNKINSKN
jgi:hypothetical protein